MEIKYHKQIVDMLYNEWDLEKKRILKQKKKLVLEFISLKY